MQSNFYFFDNLRDEIKKRRHLKNLTQEQLAKRAEVAAGTVVSIERGRGCSLLSLAAVCDALGIYLTIAKGKEK